MGCGESKHEVATGNTILNQKKSDTNTNTKNSKDIETVHEMNTKDNAADSSVPQQPAAKNEDNKEDLGGAIATARETNTKDNASNSLVPQQPAAKNEDNKEDLGGAVAAARETNAKDNAANSLVPQQPAAENEGNKEDLGDAVAAARKAEDGDENVGAAKEGDGDKEIDNGKKEGGDVDQKQESPNDYITPRKNEEGIDGIVSEGRSGESVYDSPGHAAAGKEDVLNENVKADNAVEEKELVGETKAAAKENGEAVNVEEENVVKDEDQLKTTIDAEAVLSPTSEEKNQNAEEEKKDEIKTE